ncbi:hypothetical protein HMPREF1451_00255 [Helicobacter pylori HP260BFii]|uniref:Uncharacterized protein n=1 Tax=Helicobacter pylori GAM260BSi TaxID=1159046 RepID=M3QYK7_HELPX|nr:hypothetical protein HMPREF1418_00208 [Helicobacter pylori GAM260BSi]EMH69644.1 hypothetical protein HMPREF1451_00255 [Helicobacter pylori HP260BFii]
MTVAHEVNNHLANFSVKSKPPIFAIYNRLKPTQRKKPTNPSPTS